MTGRDPLSIACPKCHALPHSPCMAPDGRGRYDEPHAIRRRHAARGWEQLQFDLDRGEADKADGMGHALDGSRDWHAAAMAWVRALPVGRSLTSEDVVAALGLPRGRRGTNTNNAVGATMNALRAAGVITSTGAHVRSRRPTSHAALIAVWRRTDRDHEGADA